MKILRTVLTVIAIVLLAVVVAILVLGSDDGSEMIRLITSALK